MGNGGPDPALILYQSGSELLVFLQRTVIVSPLEPFIETSHQ
jgi:hypothetical protein